MKIIEWILPHKNNTTQIIKCTGTLVKHLESATDGLYTPLWSYLLKRMGCMAGDLFCSATWAVTATMLTERPPFTILRPVSHLLPSQTGSFYWKEQAEKACKNEPLFPVCSSLHDSDLRWLNMVEYIWPGIKRCRS